MNIDIIKANNFLAGQFFFFRETMRFFKSHVYPTVYGGKYFITAETNPSGDKRYSVREAIDGGKRIRTAHFFKHVSIESAKDEARALAECEYRNEDEQIEEDIRANEYEFTEDGKVA